MFACMVRKPEGQIDFYLAEEDARGKPILPMDWTVLNISHWRPSTEDDPGFVLACSERSPGGKRFSVR